MATVAAKNTMDSEGFQTIGVKRGQPMYKKPTATIVDTRENNEVYLIYLSLKMYI
jgi:hypothetical protein